MKVSSGELLPSPIRTIYIEYRSDTNFKTVFINLEENKASLYEDLILDLRMIETAAKASPVPF